MCCGAIKGKVISTYMSSDCSACGVGCSSKFKLHDGIYRPGNSVHHTLSERLHGLALRVIFHTWRETFGIRECHFLSGIQQRWSFAHVPTNSRLVISHRCVCTQQSRFNPAVSGRHTGHAMADPPKASYTGQAHGFIVPFYRNPLEMRLCTCSQLASAPCSLLNGKGTRSTS